MKTILVIGGMDCKPTPKILADWLEFAATGLPDHNVIIVSLMKEVNEQKPYPHVLRAFVPKPTRPTIVKSLKSSNTKLESITCRLGTNLLSSIDKAAQFYSDGSPSNLAGKIVAPYIKLPLKYLYDVDHYMEQNTELAEELLNDKIDLIVGFSFGGSLALDHLIFFNVIDCDYLITLGTNFGEILTNSSLYTTLHRNTSNKIVIPSYLTWKHFVSTSDIFVGAHAQPKHFDRIDQTIVDTGSLLQWPPNRAHSARCYLATPQVRQAIMTAIES